MRKFATPLTIVPGATPQMEGEGVMAKQARDKKGRPLWDMPKPTGIHETTQVVRKVVEVDGKPRSVKVKEKVAFPVYRGVSASYARYVRSQIRRMRRRQTMLQRMKDDSLGFIKNVLNPIGG